MAGVERDCKGMRIIAKNKLVNGHSDRIHTHQLMEDRRGREWHIEAEGDPSVIDWRLGGTAGKRKRSESDDEEMADAGSPLGAGAGAGPGQEDDEAAWEDVEEGQGAATVDARRKGKARAVPQNRRAPQPQQPLPEVAVARVTGDNGKRVIKRLRRTPGEDEEVTPTPEAGPSSNTRSRARSGHSNGPPSVRGRGRGHARALPTRTKGKGRRPKREPGLPDPEVDKITAGIDFFNVGTSVSGRAEAKPEAGPSRTREASDDGLVIERRVDAGELMLPMSNGVKVGNWLGGSARLRCLGGCSDT